MEINSVPSIETYQDRVKRETLEAYGGASCICCGETLLDGLTLEHINGDGASHRRHATVNAPGRPARGGYPFYLWLRSQGYPRETPLRVLCSTCNLSSRRHGGVCGHKLQHTLTGGRFSRSQV